jgi:hypothetical protein
METTNGNAAERTMTAEDHARQRAEWDARVAEYDRKWNLFRQRRAELLPVNKAALFTALAAGGIHTVVVEFDGCADSGQMESAAGFNATSELIEIPATKIELRSVEFETGEITVTSAGLREAIETMAYELLEQTHGGWEDGDGAHGEFTFSVAEQSIQLDYNERFTDSTNYQHEF